MVRNWRAVRKGKRKEGNKAIREKGNGGDEYAPCSPFSLFPLFLLVPVMLPDLGAER